MPSAETVLVTIFNQTYSLRSVSGAEHVRGIARLVDERMRQIASHITTHDVSRIAVLVALNIADEMQNLKARYESEIERLSNPSAIDKDEVDARNAGLRENARGSWFDEIFEADMPARDRTERLSSQISAKLQSLRKNEIQESGIGEAED
ncbi:MAG TPA: cell division protein ZapA [Pyrinomonadaceae bacterium]